MKLLLCLLSVGVSAVAESRALFEAGRTDWMVRVPCDAAEPVRFAAEELTNALFRISGATFPIETSDDGVASRVIALVAGTSMDEKEVSRVHATAGGLLLMGNSPRAALYAVYDFLERELGCRWFWAGESGAYYPARTDFTLPAVDRTWQPAFARRGLFYPNGGGAVWMARNRLNAWTCDWKNRERCGFLRLYGNHTVGVTTADRTTHPEQCALVNGQRTGTAGCWSNPDFLERMARENVALAERYGLDVLQAYPADVTSRCECEACAKDPDPKSAWWRFYARLRARMHELAPALRFAALAYQEYRDLPAEGPEGREDFAFIEYAQYNRCYVHAPDAAECAMNARSFGELKAWTARAPMGIYGYEFDIFESGMYVPFWNMLADQMRAFKALGLVDVRTEYFLSSEREPRVARFQEKNRLAAWIYARLLSDAEQPVEPLVRDFCGLVYGAGASEMAAYHLAMAKAWDGQKSHLSYFLLKPNGTAGKFLNANLVRDARRRLASAKRAIAASAADPAAKARAAENVELDTAWFADWERLYQLVRGGVRAVAVPDAETFNGCVSFPMTSEKGRHQPTTVRLRAGKEALAIRFACAETNMADLVRGPTGHDPKGIFNRDVIEFFVEPTDGLYRHFAVNASGGRFDALLHDDKTNWTWTARTAFAKDRWGVEVSIPWAVFGGGRPAHGTVWKFVANRESRPEFCGFPRPAFHDLSGSASLYFCGETPPGRSLVWFNEEGTSPTVDRLLANGWSPRYVRYEDAASCDLSKASVIGVTMRYRVREALPMSFYREQLRPALTNGAVVVIDTYGRPEIWDWFDDRDLMIGDELYRLKPAEGVPPGVFRADPKKWRFHGCRETAAGEMLPYLMSRPYGKGLLVMSMLDIPVEELNKIWNERKERK